MIYPCKFYKMQVEDHMFWAAESFVLKGCVGQGDTFDEAVKSLEESEKVWMESAKEYGFEIPSIPITMVSISNNSIITFYDKGE